MNLRSFTVFALSLLLLTIVVWANDQVPEEKLSKELIGTWKLVSAKHGGRETDLANRRICLKHITPTHQTWMQIDPNSSEVITMACGTWSIKGDQFTANPKYGMGNAFLAVKGTKNTFTCKIVGDRWYHTGKNLRIEEVWQRQRPQDAKSKDGSTK